MGYSDVKLTTPGAVSTLPPVSRVEGDWVLFHPVYTPDEVKAVEVCSSNFLILRQYLIGSRFYTEILQLFQMRLRTGW